MSWALVLGVMRDISPTEWMSEFYHGIANLCMIQGSCTVMLDRRPDSRIRSGDLRFGKVQQTAGDVQILGAQMFETTSEIASAKRILDAVQVKWFS